MAGADVVALVDNIVGVAGGVEGGSGDGSGGGVASHGRLGALLPRGDLRDGGGDG